jgi:hypothetical protein
MPGPTRANRRASSPKPEPASPRPKRGARLQTTESRVAFALERWRASRDPADAEVVEAVGDADLHWSFQISKIAKTSGKLDAVVARLKSVRDVDDDPRLTTAMLRWLYEARWPGSGAAEGWSAVFERLISLRDVRAIAPLRQMAKDLPPFLGVKHRAFMAAELTRVADALERVPRGGQPVRSIVLGPASDALSIVQRVFDAPHDDDLRRVVADELLEQGNPWGEFIQLGFLIAAGGATPEQKRRAEWLAKKSSAVFSGPLGKIAKADSREYERGFLNRVLTNASMVARPDWEAAAASPYWSTVTRLEIGMISTPKWWLPVLLKNPAIRNLREIHFNRYYDSCISLERKSESAPWRVASATNVAPPWLRCFRDFIRALPEAERKRVEVGAIENRDVIQEALDEAR